MKKISFLLSLTILQLSLTAVGQERMDVPAFDKVIISPYIETRFIEGTKDEVLIAHIIDRQKIHIEVDRNTLHIYLDSARVIAKTKKNAGEEYNGRTPVYKGTQARIVIVYTKLTDISLRGEEKHDFDELSGNDELRMKIYGESTVTVHKAQLNRLHATLYGESILKIEDGSIAEQRYTSYGTSSVISTGVMSAASSITSYGESKFRLNVSDEIRLTAYGETSLAYSGNAVVKKGLTLGDVSIEKLN